MNTLSWFIYFADVVSSISLFLSIFIFLLMIVSVVVYIMSFGASFDDNQKFVKWGFGHRLVFLCCFLGIVNSFIPSKNTMYAIAASELGEAAVKSKLGQKSLQALENWINKQIPTNTDKETK